MLASISWLYPTRIHLIWVVVAAIVGLLTLQWRRRDLLAQFMAPAMQARLMTAPGRTRGAVQLLALGCAGVALVFALMRPQLAGKTTTMVTSTESADVVFVLDVSRSMLAEDTAPNRLARAKIEIGNLVEQLPRHRVGLIAFAGRAVQLCPLTPDRGFFSTVLADVTTESAGRGGTRIGEAVRTALRAFPTGAGGKLIVLITDGEDQDSYPLEAAEIAKKAGVKIVSIGLGDEKGAEIRLTDPQTGAKTTLQYDGKPVVSRLDGETLRKMALATDGAYIPAGTSAIDLNGIMQTYVRPMIAASTQTRVVPVELYAWFVLLALGAMVAAAAVGRGASAPQRHRASGGEV